MQPRLDLAHVHAPALGCGSFEHLPRSGADLAHGLDEMADAARAVGILVAVGFLVSRRLDDAYARPIGLELVGDDHRQRGAGGAVSHLGAVRHDGDDSILVDGNEDVRIGDDAMRHLLGAGGVRHGGADCRELRREDEGAGAGHAPEQAASADIGDDDILLVAMISHVRPPWTRREWPNGCAGSNRSGRCCRPWLRRSACQSVRGFSPAARRPA